MTAPLAHLVAARQDGPALWTAIRALAAALAPDERLILVDPGAGTAPALRRLAAETPRPEGTGIEVLALDAAAAASPAAWIGAAGSLAPDRPWLLFGGEDLVLPRGLAALRRRLAEGAPDLVLVNRAHRLAGAAAVLPAPDAGRWPAGPETGAGAAREAAARLSAEPERLVLSPALRAGLDAPGPADPSPAAAWTFCDAVLDRAARPVLSPEPVAAAPLPDPDPAPVFRAAAALAGTGAQGLDRALLRLDDTIALLDPARAEPALDAAARFLSSLPRRRRRAAAAHPGPSGRICAALRGRRPEGALAVLALAAAAQDRARMRAMAAEAAALRADLDLALPGPDYLALLHDIARRT